MIRACSVLSVACPRRQVGRGAKKREETGRRRRRLSQTLHLIRLSRVSQFSSCRRPHYLIAAWNRLFSLWLSHKEIHDNLSLGFPHSPSFKPNTNVCHDHLFVLLLLFYSVLNSITITDYCFVFNGFSFLSSGMRFNEM